MKVTFKQLRGDKELQEKEGFGTLFFISVILAIGFFYLPQLLDFHPVIMLGIILVFVAIGYPQLRKMGSDWAKKDDEIGLVCFYETQIEITEKSAKKNILLEHLSEVRIHYNYVQGKKYALKDITHNGIAELNLKTKTGELIRCKFLIESKQQLWDLKPIWKNLYLSGVTIKESMFNQGIKTIMFDGDLTDQKIKEFKQELNLKTVYG